MITFVSIKGCKYLFAVKDFMFRNSNVHYTTQQLLLNTKTTS